MAALSSSPTNQNLCQASKFLLSFDRLPQMTWFCQKVNLPGISMAGDITQVSPFIDAPIPGDKMIYEPLSVTFLLDEQLLSWTVINQWIKGVTFPDNFNQYKLLTLQQNLQLQQKITGAKPQYSDALLTVFSNKNNPIFNVSFSDVFPISLSSINFDVALSAEFIMTGTASFKFTNYSINRNIVPQ
jgi:hypothetical protein